MFTVCPYCGEYAEEKEIDPTGPFAICPFCHHAHRFLQQPLFIVTGPSGAGKTQICLNLVSQLTECVVLETDILWGLVDHQNYANAWLRLAKNIGQGGRPVVFCGTVLPEQLESCTELRYFSTLHYLALVCEDTALQARLLQRPPWRKSGTPEALEQMLQFNQWLKEHAAQTIPPMILYDNTHRTIQETTDDIARWIRERLLSREA
jgi:2-phosphoglycerate kinase